MTRTTVSEKLPRKHLGEPALRQKDEVQTLRELHCVNCIFSIPDVAASVEFTADLMRRCINVGMTLRAPEGKKTTKARVNWLLRQIKSDQTTGLFIRLFWPGKSEPTQYPVEELRANPDLATEGKEHLVVHSFHLFLSVQLSSKFTQQTNFIAELENVVPKFYGEFGSQLTAWLRRAPQLKSERVTKTFRRRG